MIPADILSQAQEAVAQISARMNASSAEKLGHLLSAGEFATQIIAGAIAAERERSGGASATRYRDLLVIIHPDMPAHVWDGTQMRRLDFTSASQQEFMVRDGYMFFASPDKAPE